MKERVYKDLAYGQENAQRLDLYLPAKDAFSTVVFFHGGGLEEGDKADEAYVRMARQFVRGGYAFASADYRLYPQGARYPDFICDGAAATAFVRCTT